MGIVAWTHHTYVTSRIYTLMVRNKNCEIEEVGNHKNLLVGRGGTHLQSQNSEGKDREFEANLGYLPRHSLKMQKERAF